MSNLFGNLSRSCSHSNMSKMETNLKMIEENTSKFEIRKPLFIMQDDKRNVTLQFPKREGSSSRIST